MVANISLASSGSMYSTTSSTSHMQGLLASNPRPLSERNTCGRLNTSPMSARRWQLGWMSPSAVYFWFMIIALSTSYSDTPGGQRSRHARVSNPDARMTTWLMPSPLLHCSRCSSMTDVRTAITFCISRSSGSLHSCASTSLGRHLSRMRRTYGSFTVVLTCFEVLRPMPKDDCHLRSALTSASASTELKSDQTLRLCCCVAASV
mmetsp:Transcript_15675/g.39080  ORF Transcript_15675/g.39080 Transcript_15675/m.39080 type:complete len:205 (-) Transcript_15675:405-1019(-)